MGRRGARETARRSTTAASAAAPVYGLTGFSSANFAATAAPGGVAWSTTGADAVLFRVPTQSVASVNRTLASRRQGAAGRWTRLTGTANNVVGCCYNGSASLIQTGARAISASDVGKLLMSVVQLDAATTLRLYVNRVQAGGGAAIVGHTPGAAPATRAGILDASLEPGIDIEIFGLAQTDQALSQAQIEAWFDAVKAAGRMVACPSITTGLVSNVTAAGSLSGTGDAMTVTGSLSLVQATPVWGW